MAIIHEFSVMIYWSSK